MWSGDRDGAGSRPRHGRLIWGRVMPWILSKNRPAPINDWRRIVRCRVVGKTGGDICRAMHLLCVERLRRARIRAIQHASPSPHETEVLVVNVSDAKLSVRCCTGHIARIKAVVAP
jgi:hypothetical protein